MWSRDQICLLKGLVSPPCGEWGSRGKMAHGVARAETVMVATERTAHVPELQSYSKGKMVPNWVWGRDEKQIPLGIFLAPVMV